MPRNPASKVPNPYLPRWKGARRSMIFQEKHSDMQLNITLARSWI
jgi:hypothetical protein